MKHNRRVAMPIVVVLLAWAGMAGKGVGAGATAAAGTACDDGEECTATATCSAGVCARDKLKSCDDGNSCTTDRCSTATGKCGASNKSDGAACDDGQACTSGETCAAGKCVTKTATAAEVSTKLSVPCGFTLGILAQGKAVTALGAELIYTCDQGLYYLKNGYGYALAGNRTSAGYSDATGTSARFRQPCQLADDGAGNMLIADLKNHRVRKLDAKRIVTTIAGDGTAGYKDGPALQARFNMPRGIARLPAGGVAVAETGNNCLRVIGTDGNVKRLAGACSTTGSGYIDGNADTARFKLPCSLAVDPLGNYVADCQNHVVRKVTPAGVTTTVAGNGAAGTTDGKGAAARFNGPISIALTSGSDLVVIDYYSHRVRRVTLAGVVTTLTGDAKGFKDGPASSALFNGPIPVAVGASDDLYIGDRHNKRIRRYRTFEATCDDKNPCTIDSCDAKANKCVHTPAWEGAVCAADSTCVKGVCTKK